MSRPRTPTKQKNMTRSEIMRTVVQLTQLDDFKVYGPAILAENLLVELEKYGGTMQQSTRSAILVVSATLMKQQADQMASDIQAQMVVDNIKRPG